MYLIFVSAHYSGIIQELLLMSKHKKIQAIQTEPSEISGDCRFIMQTLSYR